MIKFYSLLLFICISTFCQSQTKDLDDRTIDYYFNQYAEIQLKELIKEKVFIDSITIVSEYRDSVSNHLNEKGRKKYLDITIRTFGTYFNSLLYQQKVEFQDDYYILYFSMAGFDDMTWTIIKMKKDSWNGNERLTEEDLDDKSTEYILSNYDEGEKNLENIRIFIQDDYLVMERGNLYHSLYNLNNQEILINEVSPWHSALDDGEEDLNKWIKENLHDKIDQILNGDRTYLK